MKDSGNTDGNGEPAQESTQDDSAMRRVEECPFRESLRVEGLSSLSTCGLLQQITGVVDESLCTVGHDACKCCCKWPVPSDRRINPVIASLLGNICDEVLRRGDVPGSSEAQARETQVWARYNLAALPHTRTRKDRSGPVHLARLARAAIVIAAKDSHALLTGTFESVLTQSVPPAEIMILGAERREDLQSLVRECETPLIQHVYLPRGGSLEARRLGLVQTQSEVLCFLDEGDQLANDYLEQGLPLFSDPRVAIVYSDVISSNGRDRFVAQDFSAPRLERFNYIHRASLVRRKALEVADAFQDTCVLDCDLTWLIWKRIVEAGWQAAKQSAACLTAPGFSKQETSAPSYFERAALSEAEITIFTPLAGRAKLWPHHRNWLDRQTWPRDKCRLMLLDTSGVEGFSRTVRQYLVECEYADTRYVATIRTPPGLADRPRRQNLSEVRLVCAKIYNRMARGVTTPFVLVVEDDIVPPVGVISGLLCCIDSETAMVAAPYRSRFHDGFVVWDDNARRLPEGIGVQEVGGAGFGCALIRREVLVDEPFNHGNGLPDDYDYAFCQRLRKDRWKIKVDWSLECDHLTESEVSDRARSQDM